MPDPNRSHIEISGFTARFYDAIMNIVTLKGYEKLLRRAIEHLQLQEEEIVADFGAGTGKNAQIMLELQPNLKKVYLVDIGKEMLAQAQNRFDSAENVHIINQSITEDFELPEKVHRIFMSFVFHGFEPHEQDKIVHNIRINLEDNGIFSLFDWAEFDLDKSPWYVKLGFTRLECPIAQDFIKVDWKRKFQEYGFEIVSEKFFYHRHFRLLQLRKI